MYKFHLSQIASSACSICQQLDSGRQPWMTRLVLWEPEYTVDTVLKLLEVDPWTYEKALAKPHPVFAMRTGSWEPRSGLIFACTRPGFSWTFGAAISDFDWLAAFFAHSALSVLTVYSKFTATLSYLRFICLLRFQTARLVRVTTLLSENGGIAPEWEFHGFR